MKELSMAEKEWAAPIVLPPEKDVSLRCSIDYRKLYCCDWMWLLLIPRTDQCIDPLEDPLILPNLDANRGYWEVEIKDVDGFRTAITSHHRLYQLCCRTIGPRNAPRTLQQTMDVTLSPVEDTDRWKLELVYLDDNIIFSWAANKHIEHFCTLLLLQCREGLTLKLKKCKLYWKCSTIRTGNTFRSVGNLASH